MFPLRTVLCLLVAASLLSGCNDSTSPGRSYENALTGTRWVASGWDEAEGAQVLTPVDVLEGDVVGYAFERDGELVYRSFGFCATPPLSFFDVPGAWALGDDDVLEMAYYGAVPENPMRYEIVLLTDEELHLRWLEYDSPAHSYLQGTWEGTFASSSTNPQVGAPVQVSNVTFTVEGAAFQVTSDQALLPPPATGLLAVGEVMALRDLSVHTADYDWRLNINGHFTWSLEDGELVLHQDMRTWAVAREFRLRLVDD